MKKISIIIPFYNEVENLEKIYSECTSITASSLKNYSVEILFLDNHSTDGSFEVAAQLASSDPSVKVIRLSRNFGYQSNILSGYSHCTGDAAIQLDADGEDDPALIPKMVSLWEEGYQVVYGRRQKRVEGFIIQFQRKLYYRLINALSSIPLPLDAGDFQLLDRKVLNVLKECGETNLYLRGLIAYAGFRSTGFDYHRRPRYKGITKFSWFDYVGFGWKGILSFSSIPLKWIATVGILMAGLSMILSFAYLVLYLNGRVQTQGFTTLILVQFLLGGIQLLSMGLIGSYIGAIFDEVKGRPRFIVENYIQNHEKPELKKP